MLSLSMIQMREWEHAAEQSGISTLTLMENAGRGIAELIRSRFSGTPSVLIVCGKGNNAGDGFVAARYLFLKKKKVVIFLLADPSELKGSAKINFEKCETLGIPVKRAVSGEEVKKFDLIVDAVLGTGVTREVTGVFREAIALINGAGRLVMALDIPSGLHADTGQIMGAAVKASHTAAFGAAMHGLFSGWGPSLAGEVTVLGIGLPPEWLEKR